MSKAKTLLKIELLKDGLSMEDLQRLLKSKRILIDNNYYSRRTGIYCL